MGNRKKQVKWKAWNRVRTSIEHAIKAGIALILCRVVSSFVRLQPHPFESAPFDLNLSGHPFHRGFTTCHHGHADSG